MRASGILFLTSLILFLTGCASMRVETNSTAFYSSDFRPHGTISVLAAQAELNSSLEFAVYKQKFEAKLVATGYQIEADAQNADFIALVAYGIDSGKTMTMTTPIFGHTGGGTVYSSGNIVTPDGNRRYNAMSYQMPTYGVVGTVNNVATLYNRAIALDIVVAKSLSTGKVQKVYEARTSSEGGCPVIVEVFDEMLEAMFNAFPGENGRNRHLVLKGEYNC
jgi:hypothetical protein